MENWRGFLEARRSNLNIRQLKKFAKQLGLKPGQHAKHPPTGAFIAVDVSGKIRAYDSEDDACGFATKQSCVPKQEEPQKEPKQDDAESNEPTQDDEDGEEENPRLAQKAGWTFI